MTCCQVTFAILPCAKCRQSTTGQQSIATRSTIELQNEQMAMSKVSCMMFCLLDMLKQSAKNAVKTIRRANVIFL